MIKRFNEMKKKIDIFSLVISITGILPSIYFLIKMATTLLFRYKMTIIPFVINMCFFVTGIILQIIGGCISICKRKKFNIIPSAIVLATGIGINIISIIVLICLFR